MVVEEERIGLRGRIGRVLFFLIIMLLVAIFIAAQLGLRASRPSVVDARIFPQSTADYAPWDLISIRRVDPLVGTLIAQDFLATSSPSAVPLVAFVPTATATPTRELPTLVSSLTPSLSPTPTLTNTPSVTASTVPSLTPVDTLVPSPTPTMTATPTLTLTPSTTPTNTPTSTLTPTLTRTPTPTATTQVIVSVPTASFIYTQTTGISPFQVSFTSTSSGSITNYLWNFGDGTTSTQANPGHGYLSPGVYTVTLTVYGPGGATTASQTISVLQAATITPVPTNVPPPVPNFSFVQVTSAIRRIDFTNLSSGTITSFNWSFGDSGSSTQVNPSHTYTAAGTYNVTLVVSGPGGTNSLTRTITVYDRPTASFNVNPPAPLTGQTATFIDSSSGNITSRSWDFGDGGTSTAVNPTHTYTSPGTYTVRLTVTGPGGSTTSTQIITVTSVTPTPTTTPAAPVADFIATPTTAIVGQTVTFMDVSTGAITGWSWDFGDGGSSSQQNPTYAYSAPGSYTVRLTVTGPGGIDSRPRTVTVVPPTADLTVSMTVSNANPSPGNNVQFTIIASNNGPSDATNVSVQTNITLSASDQVTYISNSAGTYDPLSGAWTIGTLNIGTSQSITVTAQVNSAITNPTVIKTATISASSPADPDTSNNSASQTLTIRTAELGITKTLNNPAPDEGNIVIFTLTVTNNGPDNDPSVTVTDLLPAGLTYVSDDSGGNYNSGSGVWNVGSLAASGSTSLQISASVDVGTAGTSITNTASVSGALLDSVGANDTSSATLTVGTGADLALTKSVNNATPEPGDNITFTITLTNNGPNSASGVQVTDILPAGLTFVSAVPAGQYNSGTGIWTVQPVSGGNARTLTINAQVNTGAVVGSTITNTATITASSIVDPNAANDSASVSILVSGADLSLTMTVNNATPLPGETITLTVTIDNAGPSDATNVKVGVRTFPLIPAGGSASFTVDIDIALYAPPGAPPNPFLFVAEITASDQFDPDSTPNNNVTTEDDYDSVTIDIQPAADLSVSITADNTNPTTTSDVTLTVTVDNLGPVDATGVSVDVPLPVGLMYVSDDGGTAYNPLTGVWDIGAVAVSDGPKTLNIVATVVAVSTSIDVTADVSGSPTDQNPANSSDTVTLTVP